MGVKLHEHVKHDGSNKQSPGGETRCGNIEKIYSHNFETLN